MSNDLDFFSHLGQFIPLVSSPHFLQNTSIPATSRGLVLEIFTIKINTIKTPIAIPMYASTMYTVLLHILKINSILSKHTDLPKFS